uniref:Uncharacterized protein n=1 Tax=Anguilla anguilla TaxID=7936 RepID=A0A0E9VJB8_ANGAN
MGVQRRNYTSLVEQNPSMAVIFPSLHTLQVDLC